MPSQINRVTNAGAAMPAVARRVPSHDAMPNGDPVELKRRARAAWQRARQRGALPPAVIDKLWADGLAAAQSAPAGVVAVMMYRSEFLFSLLLDRGSWLQHNDAPSTSTPHPKLRAQRFPRWSR